MFAVCVCSQEYQQWACLEFYLTRPQEHGGCGGDAKSLCRHLLTAIMDQELRFVFQRGEFIIASYWKSTADNVAGNIANHWDNFMFSV